MYEFKEAASAVFVKTDGQGRIVAITSSDFLENTNGWLRVDEGYGSRYRHAQSQYLPGGLRDENGCCRWKLEDGKPVERTKEEMDADYTPPEDAPEIGTGNLAAEVAALRESNAQLQEALELLLSGEVDSDG